MKNYQLKAEYAKITINSWGVRIEGKHLEDFFKQLFEVEESVEGLEVIGNIEVNLKVFESVLETNIEEVKASVICSNLQLGGQ